MPHTLTHARLAPLSPQAHEAVSQQAAALQEEAGSSAASLAAARSAEASLREHLAQLQAATAELQAKAEQEERSRALLQQQLNATHQVRGRRHAMWCCVLRFAFA